MDSTQPSPVAVSHSSCARKRRVSIQSAGRGSRAARTCMPSNVLAKLACALRPPREKSTSWKSVTPDSAPGAELSLQTELSGDEAGMGDTVRLTTTVGNLTGEIVPSPIARIGLPAGLEAQTWQLDELKERGVIAFYETRPREVTLYWDGIHADETHEVKLDLLASVPGRFTAPASSAYPYYDDDEMAWAAGTRVVINP